MIKLPWKRGKLTDEECKSVQERLEKHLKGEIEAHEITKAQIFEEMTESEKGMLSSLVGMPYVEAVLNRLGVPDGERAEGIDEG